MATIMMLYQTFRNVGGLQISKSFSWALCEGNLALLIGQIQRQIFYFARLTTFDEAIFDEAIQ